MLDIHYQSGSGGVAGLNGGIYVGKPNDLFSREWDYEIGYRALSSATRGARKATVKAFFADLGKADELRRMADCDVANNRPGKLYVGDWSQRCLIVASSASKIGVGCFSAELTLVLLDGVWRKASTTQFMPVQPAHESEFLDLPYDLPYDLGPTPPRQRIENPAFGDSPVRITVYGPASFPAVRVANNLYRVNVAIPDGGYMVVDPLDRTVTVVAANGDTVDAFSKADRGDGAGSGEYIFERVPAGTSEVSWDNTFGFDLTLYEEESEPSWC